MSATAKRILDLMEEKSLSYAELSLMTGIAKSALQRYATGQTAKIPIDRLERIAAALETNAGYLIGWEDAPSETYTILSRGARNLNEEQQKQLLEMARVLFKEAFRDDADPKG